VAQPEGAAAAAQACLPSMTTAPRGDQAPYLLSSASTLLREFPTFATASLTAFCVTLCFCAKYLTS